jgi:hypothetical protein
MLALEEGLREILRKIGPLCCGEYALKFRRADASLCHPETIHGARPHDRITNCNKVMGQTLGFMVLDQRAIV